MGNAALPNLLAQQYIEGAQLAARNSVPGAHDLFPVQSSCKVDII
jgi:hypothetical protein